MSKKLPGLQRTRRPKAGEPEATGSAKTTEPKNKEKPGAAHPRAKTATASRKTAPRKSAAPVFDAAPSEPAEVNAPALEEIRAIPDEDVDVINPNETTPIERNEELRLQHREAKRIISRYAAWSSAGGLIPLPYADIAAVSGIQVRMVMALADLYRAPFSRDMVKAGVASVVGGAAPHAISAGAVSLFFKSLPGVGTIVGMAGMAGLSNLSTRILGRLFARHFATGGALQQADLKALSRDYEEAVADGKES
ncbi:MAG: DUF697 domain-containing protein [Proteobacteria bacterium]|nr:DUF697 domain-containing protein [Pseudomonadota bacterium]